MKLEEGTMDPPKREVEICIGDHTTRTVIIGEPCTTSYAKGHIESLNAHKRRLSKPFKKNLE